jgi:hypothetical protein
MLTAMTFALASGHAAPAFNGLFFATTATIIPVLFLALAVQSVTIQTLGLQPFRDFLRALDRSPQNIQTGYYACHHSAL